VPGADHGPAAVPGYRLIDIDNHYYEPLDCFTRHIEAPFRERTIHGVAYDDGLHRVYLGERRLSFMSTFPGDYTSPPGALLGLFGGERPFQQVEPIRADDYPAFTDRVARLDLMDTQGLDATVQLPTLGVVVEHEMRHDPDLLQASLRAFNRWLEDDWGYHFKARIFAVPMLSLNGLAQAVAELERVLATGARLVHLTPAPVLGRSPADPFFDPFWSRVEEAGVPVVFHVGNSGYQDSVGPGWSERGDRPVQFWSPLQWLLCHTERPIVDTLAALVLHNLFGRFPGIRVVTVENGSAWVPALLKNLDKAAMLGRRGPSLGGELADKPSDVFRAHVSVCPFVEDNIDDLIAAVGPERVVFGSDYPHPEGLVEPIDFVERLSGADDATRRLILRDNGAALLGLGGGA
jgi:predicted TIM-barrel fold metal-dependent hydrolase